MRAFGTTATLGAECPRPWPLGARGLTWANARGEEHPRMTLQVTRADRVRQTRQTAALKTAEPTGGALNRPEPG